MNNDIFSMYLNYLERKKDIEKIRLLYKHLGMKSMLNDDYDNAIYYFNLWQYTYAKYFDMDKYEYDYSILDFIERELYYSNINHYIKPEGKIKIVYLLHGICNASSVLPKILLEIIKFHDTSIFEIYVFVTDNWMQVRKSSGYVFMNQFKNSKCKIYYAPFFLHGFSKLQYIINKIHKISPHIFVSTAALAEFDQFFISSMNPAPIRIGFVFAHPAQFISKSFDYCITWVNRIANNCPIPCLNSGFTYIPFVRTLQKLKREDYNIPDNAVTIISSGRYQKFQNIHFLNSVIDSMMDMPNLHYIIVGLSENKLPPLNLSDEKIKQRIHIFEWSPDYEKYLSLADICLDTYPSGGGFVLMDAASLHIPIVSFTDSTSESFDQYDWNPAQEIFIQDSILLVDRNNLLELKSVINKLYVDKEYRIEMGNKAYISVIELYNNIDKNVKKIENLYIKLVNSKIYGKVR